MNEREEEIRRRFGLRGSIQPDMLAGDDPIHVEARRLRRLYQSFHLTTTAAECLAQAQKRLEEVTP